MKTLAAVLGAALVASCGGAATVVPDATVVVPGSEVGADANEVGPEVFDAAADGDATTHDANADGDGDAEAGIDAVSRWDIILPDAVDAGVAAQDVAPALDRSSGLDVPEASPAPSIDVTLPDDRGTVITRPDTVTGVDVVAPVDRPDVVVTTDIVATIDRPDVVVTTDIVATIDRPDVVVTTDIVATIDRPDVVAATDIVATIDRPDVVAALDRPDVVAPADVTTATDRPDVIAPAEVGAVDTGLPSGNDPVAYMGSFPVRTGVFTVTLTIAGERRSVRLAVPPNPSASPPLVLVFHGTNGDGSVAMTESNAEALAAAEGVIVAAPSSRWLPVGDFDHVDAETYWETQRNTDPDRNQDVLLTRAIMVEAQRVYRIDPSRVYAMGHSNGGFFALFLATLLPQRIAAFAVNSAGLVTCPRTPSCTFQGAGSSCSVLATRSGWCSCSGPELPIALATTGRRVPGFITHGTADPLVSVYYACTLQARMMALGMPVQMTLFDGEGHSVPANWAQRVWPFFRTLRSGP